MLPKEFRLTDDYDFRRVRRLGRVYQSPFFKLVVAPAKQRETLRFGFVISKRVAKRAVDRNRAVRLLREAVHHRLSDLKKGFDVVLIARIAILGKSEPEVGTEVNRVLSKTPLA
ncbi:ribonuclease P protein component [Candidatus Parcubacteria bacterium]|nr:ribonuclease P protein component [Candidatus Parcubacteria bacterium]